MNFVSMLDAFGNARGEIERRAPSPPSKSTIPAELAKISAKISPETDYNSIFSLVRKAVKKATGRERVGIGLAIADLPSQLGAFWEVGGNYIVMNRNLLDALKVANRPPEEINSFVFVILMHEYLHSLGYLDEKVARSMTAKICSSIFDSNHPAYSLGMKDPWAVYPFLAYVPNGNGENFRIVNNFDSESVTYIM